MATHSGPRGEPGRSNLRLTPVGPGNWRDCAALDVEDDQRRFVAPVTRYLALCAYGGGPWRPLAIEADERTVGFVMEGTDPADGSYWIGGLVIDASQQRRGYGRAALHELIARARAAGHPSVALSYEAANTVARRLYADLGFVETGETEGEELVARLRLTPIGAG